jgi:hypothetical protein
MKKAIRIFGLILVFLMVLSSYFKTNHFPGGSLYLLLSCFLFLPFMIFTIIHFYKERKSIVPNIFILISGTIFLFGFLFVMLHWPLGNLLFKFGYAFLWMVLIIVLIINMVSKNPKYSEVSFMLSIVGISLIYIATYRSTGSNIMEGYITSAQSNTEIFNVLNKYNQDQFRNNDSVVNSKVIAVREKTREIINTIEQVKKQIIISAGGNEKMNIMDIVLKDNIEITNKIMISSKESLKIKNKVKEYKNYIITLDSNINFINVVDALIGLPDPPDYTGKMYTWEQSQFANMPVIAAINNLTQLEVRIKLCEYLLLNEWRY